MTYFCLHLDIDDRSFMSFVNPSELLYDSDSSMTRRIRPILDRLLEAARCSSGVSLNVNDRIKLRNSVLSLLIALGEETMTSSEAAQTPAETPHKGSSPGIMKLREQNLLETRLQDLFYEPQSPELPVDETLYPPHRWIGLFSLTSPNHQFWQKPDRFWAKALLEDVLSASGTVVIVMTNEGMTATVFSTQIAVLPMEALMVQAKAELEQKLEIPFTTGLGGVTATISQIRTMYLQSMNSFQGARADPGMEGEMVEFIHRIVRMAMNHIQFEYANRELSLTMLAEQLDVTPNYLSSLFTSETGMTFTQHLTLIRMTHKKLLAETNLKIYQVCQSIGYSDQAYFSRLFKSQEGVSPYDFRVRSKLKEQIQSIVE